MGADKGVHLCDDAFEGADSYATAKGLAADDRVCLVFRLVDLFHVGEQLRDDVVDNPEIATKIAQYEMAFRMQASVPQVTDLSDETEATLKMYGEDARTPGTYAANCLLARRLAERGVRFIHLYHRGWDHHGDLVRYRNIWVRAMGTYDGE